MAGRPGGQGRAKKAGDSTQTKAAPKAGPWAFGGGGPSWQRQVLAKGWGYAIIVPNSIQADNGAGSDQGDHRPVQQRAAAQARRLGGAAAWAWGASRALDYFETDKAVDAKQVGIEGLSRYGKAALVAMAYDQRFAIGFIGSSGEGGAKLHRRNFGELVENLTGSGEYHWMAGNFLKYGGPLTPGDLPVDAHELIALCAPRPTFISYGASTGSGCRGPMGRPAGQLHGGRGGRPGLQAAGQEGPGHVRVSRGGDGADRRRTRLPAAQGRPHHRPELADIPGLRRPLHQSPARLGNNVPLTRACEQSNEPEQRRFVTENRPSIYLAIAPARISQAVGISYPRLWINSTARPLTAASTIFRQSWNVSLSSGLS